MIKIYNYINIITWAIDMWRITIIVCGQTKGEKSGAKYNEKTQLRNYLVLKLSRP